MWANRSKSQNFCRIPIGLKILSESNKNSSSFPLLSASLIRFQTMKLMNFRESDICAIYFILLHSILVVFLTFPVEIFSLEQAVQLRGNQKDFNFQLHHCLSKFEVPVVVNLKHIFEVFGLYTTCLFIQKLLELMVSFEEKAKIKKAGNLN